MAQLVFAFVEELRAQIVTRATLERLGWEFVSGPGVLGLLGACLLGNASTWLLLLSTKRTKTNSKSTAPRIVYLFLSELTAAVMILTSALFPWRAVRFVSGLWLFAAFLSVHARVMQQLQHPSPEVPTLTWQTAALDTWAYNLQARIRASAPRLPSLKRIAYYISQLVLIDICFFIIWEVIPVKISEPMRELATGVMTGIWVLLLMDWNYQNGIIFLDVLTRSELPHSLRHRHPLLSTSLSQFWGQRWNPVIMRALQDSFYVPLRRLGAHRAVAVLGCFAGSALLHCVPQYLATGFRDAVCMCSFFLLHGVLVLAEIGVKGLVAAGAQRGGLARAQSSNGLVAALASVSASASASASGSASGSGSGSAPSLRYRLRSRDAQPAAQRAGNTSDHGPGPGPGLGRPVSSAAASGYQWAVELGAAALAVLCLYLALEKGSAGPGEAALLALLGLLTSGGVVFVHRGEIWAAAKGDVDGADGPEAAARLLRWRVRVHSAWTLAGWAWQLIAITITLPLFSLPVFNAFSATYSHSFVVGPLLRAVLRRG